MKKCPVCGKEISLNEISVVRGTYMHKPGCGRFLSKRWVLDNFPEIVEVKAVKKEEKKEEAEKEKLEEEFAAANLTPMESAEVATASAAEQSVTTTAPKTAAETAVTTTAAAEPAPEITPETVRRVFSARKAELTSIEGVEHAVAGKDAIVVYVKSEEARSQVPSELDGIPVRTFVVKPAPTVQKVGAAPYEETAKEVRVPSDARYLVKLAWPLGERDFNCAKAHILRKPHFAGASFDGGNVVLNGEVVGRLVRDSLGYYWFVPAAAERPLGRMLQGIRSGERWGLVFEGPVRRSLRKWWQRKIGVNAREEGGAGKGA